MKRLLDKKEMDGAKSQEQKLVIDESVKLARRVNNLREVYDDEESALATLRRETLKGIHNETNILLERKNALGIEVKDLEERKKQALIPLDFLKEGLDLKKKELDEVSLKIDIRLGELTAFESKIYEKNKKAEVNLDRSEQIKKQSEQANIDSVNARTKSEISLTEAEKIKDKADDYFKSKTLEIVSHETSLKIRENNLVMREESLKDRVKKYNDLDRQIKDRYQTLLQAEEYKKNG